MSFCPKCGAQNVEGAAFCAQCGTPIQGGAAPQFDAETNSAANPFQVGSQTQTVGYDITGEAPEVPNPFRAFVICMKKYADAKGRAGRAEYFGYILVYTLLVYAVGVIIGLICEVAKVNSIYAMQVGSLIGLAIGLCFVVPAWCLLIRRLHDPGISGWFSIVNLVSTSSSVLQLLLIWRMIDRIETLELIYRINSILGIVSIILTLVLICVPGQRRPNKYGLPPQRRAK